MVVKILEPEYDTAGVEDAPRLGKDVTVDVHHEVTAHRVLHHKAHMLLKTQIIVVIRSPTCLKPRKPNFKKMTPQKQSHIIKLWKK